MGVWRLCERLNALGDAVLAARGAELVALADGRAVKEELVRSLVAGGQLPAAGDGEGDCRVVAVGPWAVVVEWREDQWRGNVFPVVVGPDRDLVR